MLLRDTAQVTVQRRDPDVIGPATFDGHIVKLKESTFTVAGENGATHTTKADEMLIAADIVLEVLRPRRPITKKRPSRTAPPKRDKSAPKPDPPRKREQASERERESDLEGSATRRPQPLALHGARVTSEYTELLLEAASLRRCVGGGGRGAGAGARAGTGGGTGTGLEEEKKIGTPVHGASDGVLCVFITCRHHVEMGWF
jgi:hypothetical protein